jgi:hypothetical protein
MKDLRLAQLLGHDVGRWSSIRDDSRVSGDEGSRTHSMVEERCLMAELEQVSSQP